MTIFLNGDVAWNSTKHLYYVSFEWTTTSYRGLKTQATSINYKKKIELAIYLDTSLIG